ncbi:MAG: hypothetical protein WBX25_04245 [Rhodomicrobium sp.]
MSERVQAYAVFEDWSDAAEARAEAYWAKQRQTSKPKALFQRDEFIVTTLNEPMAEPEQAERGPYGWTGEFVFIGTAEECAEAMEREVAREAKSKNKHKSRYTIHMLEDVTVERSAEDGGIVPPKKSGE